MPVFRLNPSMLHYYRLSWYHLGFPPFLDTSVMHSFPTSCSSLPKMITIICYGGKSMFFFVSSFALKDSGFYVIPHGQKEYRLVSSSIHGTCFCVLHKHLICGTTKFVCPYMERCGGGVAFTQFVLCPCHPMHGRVT
ncbi:hypothetical protein Ancab_000144 [Ancistrocladus abbreviatus]